MSEKQRIDTGDVGRLEDVLNPKNPLLSSRPRAAREIADPLVRSILQYPCPTEADLDDPLFNVIWQAIKGWDLQRVPDAGYAGANGNDVMHIAEVVRPIIAAALAAQQAETREECAQAADDYAAEMKLATALGFGSRTVAATVLSHFAAKLRALSSTPASKETEK